MLPNAANNSERDLLNVAIWQRARELVTQSPNARVIPPGHEAYPDENTQEVESSDVEKITGFGKLYMHVEPVDEVTLENAVLYAQQDPDNMVREANIVAEIGLGDTKVIESKEAGVFRYYSLYEDGRIEKLIEISDGVIDVTEDTVNDIDLEERQALLAELQAIEAIT